MRDKTDNEKEFQGFRIEDIIMITKEMIKKSFEN